MDYWQQRIRAFYRWVGRYKYEVHEYLIPIKIAGRVKFLTKYFKEVDKLNIPENFKRRKTATEVLEVAFMLLSRVDAFYNCKIPVAFGSGYLSDRPWAVFGKSKIDALWHFKNFESLVEHYSKTFNGILYNYFFNFRRCSQSPFILSNKYRLVPYKLANVALCLLYDVLINCGPDCEELHDIFSNDIRCSSNLIDLDEWQKIRIKTMGRHGSINFKRNRIKIGQFATKTKIPMKPRLNFDLVSQDDDLSKGEKINLIVTSQMIQFDECFFDENDDNIISPEQDANYMISISDKIKKYKHLVREQ